MAGPQPWINILCKFSDISSEPKPPSYFDGLFGATKPGLDHYWREVSYDAINILGTNKVGWYGLPQPRSYYISMDTSSMLTALFDDCTAVGDPDAYRQLHALRHAEPHQHPDRHAHRHRDRRRHCDPDTNADEGSDLHPDRHAHRNLHTPTNQHGDPNRQRYTDAD